MKTFEYMCDMGSIKILFTDDKDKEQGSCFFMNRFGDGVFNVSVDLSENHEYTQGEFLGHFTVIGNAYLMYSDCDNENRQYKFPKGRYFVHLINDTDFYMYKYDEDLHA